MPPLQVQQHKLLGRRGKAGLLAQDGKQREHHFAPVPDRSLRTRRLGSRHRVFRPAGQAVSAQQCWLQAAVRTCRQASPAQGPWLLTSLHNPRGPARSKGAGIADMQHAHSFQADSLTQDFQCSGSLPALHQAAHRVEKVDEVKDERVARHNACGQACRKGAGIADVQHAQVLIARHLPTSLHIGLF